MAGNNQKAPVVSTSEGQQPNGTSNPTVEVIPSENDDQNGNNEVVIGAPSTGKSAENGDLTKEELDANALKGKTSALEQERNQAADAKKTAEDRAEKVAEEQTKILKHMAPIFMRDKGAYEEWRQGVISEGLNDPGPHEKLFGTATQNTQAPSNQSNNQSGQQAPALNPADFNRAIDQHIEDREGYAEFRKEFPEFDPKNFNSEEDRKKAAREWNEVAAVAASMAAYHPEMSVGQLLIEANYALPQNRTKALERASLVGELKGRNDVISQGSANAGGIQGGSPKAETVTVKMNKSQLEKYNELNEKNPKLAETFARNVKNLQSGGGIATTSGED